MVDAFVYAAFRSHGWWSTVHVNIGSNTQATIPTNQANANDIALQNQAAIRLFTIAHTTVPEKQAQIKQFVWRLSKPKH